MRGKGVENVLGSSKMTGQEVQHVTWVFKGQETGLRSLSEPSYTSNTKQQAQRSQTVCASTVTTAEHVNFI